MEKILFSLMVLTVVATGCDFSEEALLGKKPASKYDDEQGSIAQACSTMDQMFLRQTVYGSNGCSLPRESSVMSVGVIDGKFHFVVAKLDDGKFPSINLTLRPIFSENNAVNLGYTCIADAGQVGGYIRNIICNPDAGQVVRNYERYSSDIRFRVAEVRLSNFDGCDSTVSYKANVYDLDQGSPCRDAIDRQAGVELGDVMISDVYLEDAGPRGGDPETSASPSPFPSWSPSPIPTPSWN